MHVMACYEMKMTYIYIYIPQSLNVHIIYIYSHVFPSLPFLWQLVALAQVMARMHLDNSGNKTTSLRSRVNFNIVRIVPTVLLLLNGLFLGLAYRAFFFHLKDQIWIFFYSSIPVLVADITMYGYFLYMTAKVRRIIRQDYNIDHYNCLGLQDELLTLFFAPFVVAQMGRHTADYDTYVGIFCSRTGLSDHIEVKLPGDVNNDIVVGSGFADY